MLFEVVGRHQQMTLGKHLMCQDEESLLVIIHNIPSVLYSKTPTLISAANIAIICSISKKKLKKTIFSSNDLAISGNVLIFALYFKKLIKLSMIPARVATDVGTAESRTPHPA